MHTNFQYPRFIPSADRQRSYQIAVAENPRNAMRTRTFGPFNKLWAPGKTLYISFLKYPVERSVKWAIFELARQWLDLSGANLDIELTDDGDYNVEIRIQLSKREHHNACHIGTDALLSDSGPSMTLNLFPGETDFERTILHEFGHAFGAQHAHQHPEADIPWNVPAVLENYRNLQGWTERDLMEQMINKNTDSGNIVAPYDRNSIMHYPVQQADTIGDWEVGVNTELSESDLEFMRLAYPEG